MIFEGLDGFKEENGMVFPGLSLIERDSENNIISEFGDLFIEYNEKGISVNDFHSWVSAHFTLNDNEIKNPLNFEIIVWDKKSDARIEVNIELFAE